jgi:glutathione S-transferase
MAITLLWNKDWPNAQAVRVTFLELGLKEQVDYDLQTVDIAAGGTKTPAFLKLNPEGELPVAKFANVDGNGTELVAWEPIAITSHFVVQALLQNLPPPAACGPVNPCEFPHTYKWSSWSRRHLGPPMETMLLHGLILPQNQRKPEKMKPALKKFEKKVALLEAAAPGQGAFLNGDPNTNTGGSFSIADAFACSILTFGRGIPKALFDYAQFPKLNAYLQSIEARQSFTHAFGPRPPIVFPP